MRFKIVKNKEFLSKPTDHVGIPEGEEIAVNLFDVLKKSGGIGLAANQIGIRKSVCVVNVKEPLVLINPKIVSKSEEKVIYAERCLSIPGKIVNTIRHTSVTVSADNLANERVFKRDMDLTYENAKIDHGLLECVCVQHEIDHLNGVLITDPSVRYLINASPTKVTFGRNDKVMIQKDGETKQIKYKKYEEYMNQGWKLI